MGVINIKFNTVLPPEEDKYGMGEELTAMWMLSVMFF